MKKARDYLAAIVSELSNAKIDFRFATGGKHKRIEWQGANGHLRWFTVASTPGDVRASRNARADIRRILREDGDLSAARP